MLPQVLPRPLSQPTATPSDSPSPPAPSPTANRPRGRAILELCTFPLFLVSLVVPHATVLYWLTNGVFGLGLQAALSRPAVAQRLGLPLIAVHARGDADIAGAFCFLVCAAAGASLRALVHASFSLSRMRRHCGYAAGHLLLTAKLS